MARLLPGLTPQRDSTVAGGGRREPRLVRTPQPQLTPRQISTPAAAPVDTYAPPPAPRGAGDGWLALAQGLRDFSPVLARFADDQMDKERQAQEARAEARIGGMTLQEQHEFIKSGAIKNWEGPFARAKFMQIYGGNAGTQAALELVKQYETGFDKNNGNLDEFIAQGQRAAVAAVGDDPFAQRQAARSFEAIASKLRPQNVQDKTEFYKTQAGDQITGQFINTRTQMQLDGTYSPQAYYERIRADMKSNAALNVMSMADQDRVLMGVVSRLADEGDLDTVQYILTDDRGGVGSLGNKREFAADATKYIERARSRQFELAQRAQAPRVVDIRSKVNDGRATDEELDAGLRDGLYGEEEWTRLKVQNLEALERNRAALAKQQEKAALAAASQKSKEQAYNTAWDIAVDKRGALIRDTKVLNESGEETTLSRSDQIQNAIQRWTEESNRKAQAENMTPAQKAVYDSVQFYAPNQFDDVPLQNTLAGAAASVRGVDVQKGLPPLGNLQDAYESWRGVYAQLPMYARQNLLKDDRDRTFYEDIRIGMEYAGLTFEQAAGQAIQLSGVARRASVNLSSTEREAIRQAADDVVLRADPTTSLGRLWWGSEGIVGPVENTGEVRSQIETLAYRNMDLGLSPQRAVEAATEQYTASHINVNGYAVMANARAYPPDIGARITRKMRDLYDGGAKDYVPEFGDLKVVPDGTSAGRWQVVDSSGLPVAVPGKGPLYITMEDIWEQMQRDAEEREKELAEERQRIIQDQNARQEMLRTPRGGLRGHLRQMREQQETE